MSVKSQHFNKSGWQHIARSGLLCSTLLFTLSACNGSSDNGGLVLIEQSHPPLPEVVPAAYARSTYSSPIALSIDNALVWAVNPSSDSVSVVRTDTQTMVGKISVGNEPRSITLSPDNKFAYVANAADNTVTVISITNATPDGFSASIFESAGNHGMITTGSEPNGVVYSPDGHRVFVSNANQDTVTVLNGADHSFIGSVDLKNSLCNVGDQDRHFHPRAMAVSQDNSKLYVTRFFSYTTETGVQKDDHGK
ncbi:MAG: YncE family protein, partial [Psychrosphaera sp.]|nr:YncE family protein [Psychrosphaera sp.]